MDILKKYTQGELGSGDTKSKNEKLTIDCNAKVKQGEVAGDGNDKPGKKSKVDPSVFKMAEQRDY